MRNIKQPVPGIRALHSGIFILRYPQRYVAYISPDLHFSPETFLLVDSHCTGLDNTCDEQDFCLGIYAPDMFNENDHTLAYIKY